MGCSKLTYNENNDTLKVAYSLFKENQKYCTGSYRYGFNGKQFDEETETSDFGARNLDEDLGIWGTIDPQYKKYIPFSPYHYALNSPIYFKDGDGRVIVDQNGNPVSITFTGENIVFNDNSLSMKEQDALKTAFLTPTGRENVVKAHEAKTLIQLDVSDKILVVPAKSAVEAGLATEGGENDFYVVAGQTTPDGEVITFKNGKEGVKSTIYLGSIKALNNDNSAITNGNVIVTTDPYSGTNKSSNNKEVGEIKNKLKAGGEILPSPSGDVMVNTEQGVNKTVTHELRHATGGNSEKKALKVDQKSGDEYIKQKDSENKNPVRNLEE